MKSSLINMVVVLLVITAVASTAVGLVFRVTEDPIAEAKLQKKLDALGDVLPEFDNQPVNDVLSVVVDGIEINVYPALKNGQTVGYAVESLTNNGFSGLIKIMVGFDAEGLISNIVMLEHAETPGLGAKLAAEDNPIKVQLEGNSPETLKMSVRKDGGDVEAITASTISSRAYLEAVRRGFDAMNMVRSSASASNVADAPVNKEVDDE